MVDAASRGCVFVVFGATGDLMARKLLPALFNLANDSLLPTGCQVLGVGRHEDINNESYRHWALEALGAAGIKPDAKVKLWCDDALHYHASAQANNADYVAIGARIAQLEQRNGTSNRVLYLALPPGAFPGTIAALGEARLNTCRGWTRLLIEKPFGRDLASAVDLNALVHRHFDEQQVYRIDHYLGKEMVQNLLAFRFGNALFESAWNRDHIESVQITVAEALGVEDRAAYYENNGALRDMVQNHLTQLLTLTAMEVPAAFEADSIRFEKVKVLRSVVPLTEDDVVFGQYGADHEAGVRRAGYREEPGVSPRSSTETFVGMRLHIENWRWQGVPFYLRTGKAMNKRVSEIVIRFRRPPVALFREAAGAEALSNVLVIALQPDDGFDLSFSVKSPGSPFALQSQRMQFRYAQAFGEVLSGGYETLLLEVVNGDQTLFVHASETEAAWQLFGPLLQERQRIHFYPAGSWGPAAADGLWADSQDSPGKRGARDDNWHN